ncbi:MAG: fumarylacetoacetate hydrolase family protein [Burkholderiaceae bacterium]|nr:fumarylacetoacetate hydrolase family protein [Burkholderiaceae bacterium]
MDTVIPLPPVATLAVAGSSARFPVRRIYCVGRNYAEHAREMGYSGREDPFFFCKPADAILNVADGVSGDMVYPPKTSNLHYEVELVVALKSGGRNLTVQQADDSIWGYAIGLDMTRRDLQADAKKQGRPWEIGKAFDQSAPIGPVHARADVGALDSGSITLAVDGVEKQSGDLSQMIWNTAEAIAYLSGYFELQAGDIILTGTPEGVGPVLPGQTMTAAIAGLGELRVQVLEQAV